MQNRRDSQKILLTLNQSGAHTQNLRKSNKPNVASPLTYSANRGITTYNSSSRNNNGIAISNTISGAADIPQRVVSQTVLKKIPTKVSNQNINGSQSHRKFTMETGMLKLSAPQKQKSSMQMEQRKMMQMTQPQHLHLPL